MHRWYDPATGRWISEDPIGFAAGDANLYRYVGNGVTGARDPSGLRTITIEINYYLPETGDRKIKLNDNVKKLVDSMFQDFMDKFGAKNDDRTPCHKLVIEWKETKTKAEYDKVKTGFSGGSRFFGSNPTKVTTKLTDSLKAGPTRMGSGADFEAILNGKAIRDARKPEKALAVTIVHELGLHGIAGVGIENHKHDTGYIDAANYDGSSTGWSDWFGEALADKLDVE